MNSTIKRLAALLALAAVIEGCKMEKISQSDFQAGLGNVEKFNAGHGRKGVELSGLKLGKQSVEGLELSNSTVDGVAFESTRLSKSDFTKTVFKDCIFKNADVSKCTFRDCSFIRCKFAAATLDSNVFEGGSMVDCSAEALNSTTTKFLANRFEKFGIKQGFFEHAWLERNSFNQVLLEKNKFLGAILHDSHFKDSRLSGNDLTEADLAGLQAEGTRFEDDQWGGSGASNGVFKNCMIRIAPDPGGYGFTFNGAIMDSTTVDLGNFGLDFGLSAGRKAVFENLKDPKAEVFFSHMSQPYSDLLVRNFQCAIFRIDEAKLHNVRFENIKADQLTIRKSELENCVFQNIQVEELADLWKSKFTNVTWTNVTKGPKAEFKMDETNYTKAPF